VSRDVPVKIVVTLEEQIALDADEALGEIELIGDDGGSISRGNAWLDAWLSAILDGLEGFLAGEKEQRIEIMAETQPLVVRPYRRGLRVTFRDETVEVRDVEQFRTELKSAVRGVVARLEEHEGFSPDETWSRLIAFAAS